MPSLLRNHWKKITLIATGLLLLAAAPAALHDELDLQAQLLERRAQQLRHLEVLHRAVALPRVQGEAHAGAAPSGAAHALARVRLGDELRLQARELRVRVVLLHLGQPAVDDAHDVVDRERRRTF